VEVLPTRSNNNLRPETGNYSSDFITQDYTLPENQPDLAIQSAHVAVSSAANVYSGISILTPYAGIQLQQQLQDYLSRPNAEVDNSALKRVGDLLNGPDFHGLSQSLGGFNEALLMCKQTLQLDPDDPLGFDDYRDFTAQVGAAVQNLNLSAPQPLNDFNPIRSGALNILRLRLVDSFGQSRDLDCHDIITTEPMTIPDVPDLVALPPRIVQPARLNFRWLAANQDEREANDHPATTPICGWVLPNDLDNSLMLYDNRGRALGSIDLLGIWESAPGIVPAVTVDSIANPHLRQMAQYLIRLGSAGDHSFLTAFHSALNTALRNIEPENYAQHPELALLMGRPIALVRALLDLEVQGTPAIHQGWNSFREDLQRNTRDTDEFDFVRFPIRLGEHQQLNDGLVGYWKETPDGYEGEVYYAPQSDAITHDNIKSYAQVPLNITQSVQSPPQFLTLLLDPRGIVHATCGIQPTKSIGLPPGQYMEALQAIEISFLTAPILTAQGFIHLPVPTEAGYQWSWLEKEAGAWSEISTSGSVTKRAFLAALPAGAPDGSPINGELVWERLLAQGWTVPIDAFKVAITGREQRPHPDLGTDMAALVDTVEQTLDRFSLGRIDTQATFSAPQEIREGWLKLRAAAPVA
jgi:hypothetical protein